MSELEMEEGCPGGAVREDDGKVMSRDQGRQKRKTRGAHPISTPAHAYVPPPINPTTIPRRSSAHHPQMAVPSPPSYPPFLKRRPNIHHSARSADPSRPLPPPSASLSHPPTHTATTPRSPFLPASSPSHPFHSTGAPAHAVRGSWRDQPNMLPVHPRPSPISGQLIIFHGAPEARRPRSAQGRIDKV